MATICVHEIAEKVGQDKPEKEPTVVYDKAHGSYKHEHDYPKDAPLPPQPSPFKLGGTK